MLKRLALAAALCAPALGSQSLIDLDLSTWKTSVDDPRFVTVQPGPGGMLFQGKPRTVWKDGWGACEREFTVDAGDYLLWVQGHGYGQPENDPTTFKWELFTAGAKRGLVDRGWWETDFRDQGDLVSQRIVEIPKAGRYVFVVSMAMYATARIDATFKGAVLTPATRPALYAWGTGLGINPYADTNFGIVGRYTGGARFFAVFASSHRRSVALQFPGVVGEGLWLRDPVFAITVTSRAAFWLNGTVPLPPAFWQVAEFRVGDRGVEVALGSRNYVTTASMR